MVRSAFAPGNPVWASRQGQGMALLISPLTELLFDYVGVGGVNHPEGHQRPWAALRAAHRRLTQTRLSPPAARTSLTSLATLRRGTVAAGGICLASVRFGCLAVSAAGVVWAWCEVVA